MTDIRTLVQYYLWRVLFDCVRLVRWDLPHLSWHAWVVLQLLPTEDAPHACRQALRQQARHQFGPRGPRCLTPAAIDELRQNGLLDEQAFYVRDSTLDGYRLNAHGEYVRRCFNHAMRRILFLGA